MLREKLKSVTKHIFITRLIKKIGKVRIVSNAIEILNERCALLRLGVKHFDIVQVFKEQGGQ